MTHEDQEMRNIIDNIDFLSTKIFKNHHMHERSNKRAAGSNQKPWCTDEWYDDRYCVTVPDICNTKFNPTEIHYWRGSDQCYLMPTFKEMFYCDEIDSSFHFAAKLILEYGSIETEGPENDELVPGSWCMVEFYIGVRSLGDNIYDIFWYRPQFGRIHSIALSSALWSVFREIYADVEYDTMLGFLQPLAAEADDLNVILSVY